jgi:formylglycine-generating enzyme
MRLAGLLIIALFAANLDARVPRAGAVFRDAPFAPQMVVIPAGRAMIGSTEAETEREGRSAAAAMAERPRREIAFDQPFAVGKHHVTLAEFSAFVRATKRPMAGCVVVIGGKWSDGPQPDRDFRNVGWKQRADEPALCVAWADAVAYAEWLSHRTGHRYRLLTEDEWEYAARGGTATARWWGDGREQLCRRANGGDRTYAAVMPEDKTANLACADGFAYTNPAGRFPPNPFGLHDMIGNAWQWVGACFTRDEPCTARSIRGGSWHNGPAVLRAATRFSLPPTMRSSSLGFRVMRELPGYR